MSLKMSNEERIFKITPVAGPVLRALIVDRDSMSSHLLADALVRNRKCDASAISSGDLLQSLAAGDTDLVVIGADLSTGPGSGFDLAETVGRSYPEMILVLLLNETTQEAVLEAFRRGARGVFSRQQSMVDFLDCVDHVKKGYIWAGREETNYLLMALKNLPAPTALNTSISPLLTKREFEVVEHAAKGKTNKVIASELGLSEHTVKNYLFRAFDKLGVSSRVELLFYLTVRGHTFSGSGPEIPEADGEEPPASSDSAAPRP